MTTTKGKAIQMGVSVDASIDGSVAGSIDASVADSIDGSIDASVAAVSAEDLFHDSTPGKVLSGARGLRGLTQAALAAAIGIHKSHISGMERDVRPIGKAMAKKLGHALEMNWRIFL
ncbi:MAG: helix-turn-helix domain-containing protein [Desulfomicrobium sp.]|nr:helix-turn-helix domain-containing protein [Pseudomonadota bacterium]MBV1712019.1 helix-turn-helix domain-containing protein [Desulfomicrobium sp.]MBV1719589.1 helix-turn-helix domain-containing protein [Desulfomicrobium sp.]MBV1748324.1 helix-turn-helix domain-containing protein [Desulfomicrobium sp.]